jgi:hypothetical protein
MMAHILKGVAHLGELVAHKEGVVAHYGQRWAKLL